MWQNKPVSDFFSNGTSDRCRVWVSPLPLPGSTPFESKGRIKWGLQPAPILPFFLAPRETMSDFERPAQPWEVEGTEVEEGTDGFDFDDLDYDPEDENDPRNQDRPLRYGEYNCPCPDTGLPMKPPPHYENGQLRYKRCRKCWEVYPMTDFYRRVLREDQTFFDSKRKCYFTIRAGVYRMWCCRYCKNKIGQKWRDDKRRHIMTQGLNKTAKAKTTRTALAYLALLAEELGIKKPETLVKYWAELALNPEVKPRQRMTAYQTAVHIQALAELERLKMKEIGPDDVDPVEYVKVLAERGQLAPLVRACLEDGLLTWDQIDPAPEDIPVWERFG